MTKKTNEDGFIPGEPVSTADLMAHLAKERAKKKEVPAATNPPKAKPKKSNVNGAGSAK